MMNETQLAAAVLASIGVEDYDPKVTGLLAEYLRRNVNDLLTESLDYAQYARRKHIDISDARLAAQAKDTFSSSSPIPPRDRMVQVAAVINSQKLEPFPPSFTPSLPPLSQAAGDELLANDYVAGTPRSISLLSREGEGVEGGMEVEEEEGVREGGSGTGEEAAPARMARRGEKNLRLMMSGGGGGGRGGGEDGAETGGGVV
ncbi:tata binding protein associated factor 21kda subunit isoform 1 [Nannochloropsis oceanica]